MPVRQRIWKTPARAPPGLRLVNSSERRSLWSLSSTLTCAAVHWLLWCLGFELLEEPWRRPSLGFQCGHRYLCSLQANSCLDEKKYIFLHEYAWNASAYFTEVGFFFRVVWIGELSGSTAVAEAQRWNCSDSIGENCVTCIYDWNWFNWTVKPLQVMGYHAFHV